MRLGPSTASIALHFFGFVSGQTVRDYKTEGLPLVQPQQIRLAEHPDGFQLEMAVLQFAGPTATFATRAYNGAIPGPTLIFSRGQRNRLRLTNSLQGPDSAYSANQFSRPSTTNIHTHGLHLPSQIPGDDVSVAVPPGADYDYAWDVPADHAPGTHWYHPHLHGSTALQTGGGSRRR
jgi:FtsP/CotA-like multicopper oxidase with cupredoxin domain